MRQIELAKKELIEGNNTLVAFKDNNLVFKSNKSGIKPIYELVVEEKIKDIVIADRVIGKGAALLCIYGDINQVYGELMSDLAIELFKENNIEYEYDIRCENILNRDKTDYCPIEKIAIKNKEEDFIKELEKFLNI